RHRPLLLRPCPLPCHGRNRRGALLVVGAVGVAAALMAGCSSSGDAAQRASRSALEAQATQSTTTTTTKPAPACDLNESLTPMTPLPAPALLPRGGAVAAIQARGQIVAGVDLNTLLLSYQDPRTGTLQGFEIDLLHRLARAIFGDDDNRIRFVALTTA